MVENSATCTPFCKKAAAARMAKSFELPLSAALAFIVET
jgi:hypothetical protein